MHTPASVAGHPIHPMIVPIAIGGFILSFAFDIVGFASGNDDPWAMIAYYMMLGGIVGALFAAVPGLIDLISLPSGQTKKIALTHMGINLTVVALYVVNAWMRSGNPESLKLPALLSFLALCLLVVSGWLGGKMVFEAGVGVDSSSSSSAPSAPARSSQGSTHELSSR
jgi:uncharacterized membrane protein